FNIGKEEYKLIENFVIKEGFVVHEFEDLLTVNQYNKPKEDGKHLQADLNGEIIFMKVSSVDMYFVKYVGKDEILLNGFIMKNNSVYLFSHGSTIKTPKGAALYYSDLIRIFIEDHETNRISFNANE